MKAKTYDQVGRFRVGQLVRWSRPDPESVKMTRIGNWAYIEDRGVITAMRQCESGVLVTINAADGRELTAHLHLGIHDMKQIAYVGSCETIQVLQEAPRQMEIAA
jgi:hypothetical protein